MCLICVKLITDFVNNTVNYVCIVLIIVFSKGLARLWDSVSYQDEWEHEKHD